MRRLSPRWPPTAVQRAGYLSAVTLLAVVTALAGFGAHDPSVAAQADAEPGIELVSAAYNVLNERFVRPVDSRALLTAAWQGARSELSRQQRLSAGVDAPDLVGDRDADLSAFQAAYRALVGSATGSVDASKVAMETTDAMVSSVGEQHTAFLTPEQFGQFRESLTSDRSVVGIGIQLAGERGPFAIQSVFPGTPAAQAGLLAGDVIVAVDGRDVSSRDIRGLSQLLRGDAGTGVAMTVRRGAAPLDFSLIRARYTVPPLVTRVLPEGVCLLALSSFPFAFSPGPSGLTIGPDLDAALERCEAAGAKGWIVDLRGNGGGSSLGEVAGRFLDGVPLLVERDRAGGRYEQSGDGHLFRVQRPMAVIIDGQSASASEAFASVIQENRRGVVVGQRSPGVLNTAGIVALPLDSGMEVAIREVFTGRLEVAVDGVGVSPDLSVSGLDRSTVPKEAIAAVLNPPAGVGPLPPLAPEPRSSVLPAAEIRKMVEPLQLKPSDAESSDEAVLAGDLVIDTLSYYSGDSPNLAAGRDRGVRLGWRGGFVRWLGRGFPPIYALDVELYREADGAHRDLREIYEPGEPHNPPQSRDVEATTKLGDDTRFQVGTGQNDGRIWIAWRRGGTAFVVSRTVQPGQPKSFDGLVRLAQVIDARAASFGW